MHDGKRSIVPLVLRRMWWSLLTMVCGLVRDTVVCWQESVHERAPYLNAFKDLVRGKKVTPVKMVLEMTLYLGRRWWFVFDRGNEVCTPGNWVVWGVDNWCGVEMEDARWAKALERSSAREPKERSRSVKKCQFICKKRRWCKLLERRLTESCWSICELILTSNQGTLWSKRDSIQRKR